MKSIIIAFSSGPDSVFLAEKFRKQNNYHLILAHFNHRIRSDKEHKKEEYFTLEYGKKNNIIVEIEKWKKPKESETEARTARYYFLEKIRQKYNADYIVTAHHLNDNAETIFMQVLRGGGIKSLSGILEKDENRKLWRPLLNISKKEILEFLAQEGVSYCTDKTNNESTYTRNFLRNDIFPMLEKKFPNFQQRIVRNTDHFIEINSMISRNAEEFLKKNSFYNGVKRKNLFLIESPVRFEIYSKLFKGKFLEKKFINNLELFFQTGLSGKIFEGKGEKFMIYSDTIFLEKK